VIPELEKLEGKYEVLRKLREGGMGAIYLVRHRLLEELRVVKLLRPQLSDEAEFRGRFLREARVAIQLRHPNVAQLYDFALDDSGTGYMVLEYVDGRNLQELIAEGALRSLRLEVEIAIQALDALGFLHRRGFVHRDVSPDNLMLTVSADGEPKVKLIDLGIVKVLHGESAKTGTHVFLGKVRYASPEQFEGSQVDTRSDLYSFGVLLYELLTGVHPFQGGMHSVISGHMFRAPLPFDEADPHGRVPEALRQVVLDALSKSAEERIQTAEEFVRRLRAVELPVEPEPARLETLRLDAAARAAAGSEPPGSLQRRLDSRFAVRDATPEPELLTERAAAGVGEAGLAARLDEAEALLADGQPEAAAYVLKRTGSTERAGAETTGRRERLARMVGDELIGKKVGEWRALLDEPDEEAVREAASPAPERAPRRAAPALVAAGIVLAVLAGVVATRWLGRGGTDSGRAPGSAAPAADTASAPVAAAAEPALLVLDARPWGSVAELRSLADGRELAVPGDGFTPLRMALAAGRYRAVIVHPSFGSRTLEVELAAGRVEAREVRFGGELAESFVRGF
jgi:serine/threonine-protein kinase